MLMYEQAIPVSVHAWMDGLHKIAPSFEIQDYLTISETSKISNSEKEYAADVSDTIIFDFIIDGNYLFYENFFPNINKLKTRS